MCNYSYCEVVKRAGLLDGLCEVWRKWLPTCPKLLCRSLEYHSGHNRVRNGGFFGARSLASRLTSGEQFVPSAVELGPVPLNKLSELAPVSGASERWQAGRQTEPVRRRARAHGQVDQNMVKRPAAGTPSGGGGSRTAGRQDGWCQGPSQLQHDRPGESGRHTTCCVDCGWS